MRRPVNSFTRITSVHGQVTNMGKFGKHLGVDYATPTGTTLHSPVIGTITKATSSTALGKYYEIVEDGNSRIHRLAHNSELALQVGARVSEGQIIGKTGNTGITTGPHCHWDVRKAGTAWDASFYNYYNPELLIAQSQPPKPSGMPPVNSKIKLTRGYNRNTYVAGTTTVAGTIRPTDDTFIYTVYGYDPKFPYRVLINSKSAGENGVALALYYTNGTRIAGWALI